MTPEITLRTFTDDQYVLDKIFYANNYRIKKFPEEEKVTIVDIGAHVGFFSLLCAMRGADQIYCVEPFTDNFRVLNENLESFSDRVTALKMGVYTESKFANISHPEPDNNFYHLSHLGFHNGDEKPSDMAYFTTLDQLLEGINDEKVTLLKIHIGYAEAEILLSSNLINKCDFVCGETTASKDKLQQLIDSMKEKGFKDSFLAESKEQEGTHMVLFAKNKCEDLFNLYASEGPDGGGMEPPR